MKVIQWQWTEKAGWQQAQSGNNAFSAQLILFFGAACLMREPDRTVFCKSNKALPGKRRFGNNTVFTAMWETLHA